MAFVGVIAASTMGAPGGWTSLGAVSLSTTTQLTVWQKTATGSEGSSYAFTASGGSKASVWVGAFSGWDGNTPVFNTDSNNLPDTSLTGPAVTTNSGAWYVNAAVVRDAATGTAFTLTATLGTPRYTAGNTNAGTGNDIGFGVWTQADLPSGTGSDTISLNQAYNRECQLGVAITPLVSPFTSLGEILGMQA